jgi:hypothetical protein
MYSLEDLNSPENEVIKADAIMDLAMSQLFEMCIEPMQDELDQEELNAIGVIGLALKAIADKAKCYEEMMENGHGSNYGGANDFSQN